MSRPIKFTPRAQVEDTPQEELQRLLRTLHETGTLRLLNAVVGRFSDVAEVVADGLETQPGRHMSSNFSAIVASFSVFSPDQLHRVLLGAAEGLKRAQGEAGRPPSLFQLLRRFRHDDTRAGLNVIVSILSGIGYQARHAQEPRQLAKP